ncbi:MAG: hypothetical protein ABIG10_00330 [bacterium]
MKQLIIVTAENEPPEKEANEKLAKYNGKETDILFADTKVFEEGGKIIFTTTIALDIK